VRKRTRATPAQVEQAKRAFWEGSAEFAFARAARRVRKGLAVEERDRAFIALWLEELRDRETIKRQKMGRVQVKAQVADELVRTLRISKRAAAEAVAGNDRPASVLRAITRLHATRRKRK
jgi:hypothetical protein